MTAAATGARAFGSGALTKLAHALFAIDLRALAAFRIMCSLAMLARLIEVGPHVAAFLTDEGVFPRAAYLAQARPEYASLYLINGTLPFALALFALNALAALALLVGYRARLMAAICWVLWLSMARRNPLITTGGDPLLSLLLFWAIFLPIGAVFAVDAAMNEEDERGKAHLSVASAGLLLQATWVYVFGALLKTGPEWTTLGSAVYAALHLDTIATPLAHWFRQFNQITWLLTFYVLWLELLTPALLFSPIRTALVRAIALPFLMTMHLGFRLFLDIGNFWAVSLASLTAFTPRLFWDWAARWYWRPAQRGIVIHYDPDCAFCRRTALILREFFLPRATPVLPAQGDIAALLEREQSWVVEDGAGRRLLHWRALSFVTQQSLLLKPIGWLVACVGAIGAGRPLYAWIGRRRRTLAPLTADIAVRPFALSRLMQALLAAAIVFCFAYNVRQMVGEARFPYLPDPVVRVARALNLTQRWQMFAPFPQIAYVVPVVTGRLEDGRSVDALTGRYGAPAIAWPRYPVDSPASSAWRRYFDGAVLRYRAHKHAHLELYAAYVCRDWNRRSERAAMTGVTITLLWGRTLSGFRKDRSRHQTFDYACAR